MHIKNNGDEDSNPNLKTEKRFGCSIAKFPQWMINKKKQKQSKNWVFSTEHQSFSAPSLRLWLSSFRVNVEGWVCVRQDASWAAWSAPCIFNRRQAYKRPQASNYVICIRTSACPAYVLEREFKVTWSSFSCECKQNLWIAQREKRRWHGAGRIHSIGTSFNELAESDRRITHSIHAAFL